MMRTTDECRAMALQMEGRAALATGAVARDDWLLMAAFWLDLGRQAAWQDGWITTPPA